ncbi:hypothetical protein Mgra_00003770, partial [Meloidogyne graminicola]
VKNNLLVMLHLQTYKHLFIICFESCNLKRLFSFDLNLLLLRYLRHLFLNINLNDFGGLYKAKIQIVKGTFKITKLNHIMIKMDVIGEFQFNNLNILISGSVVQWI